MSCGWFSYIGGTPSVASSYKFIRVLTDCTGSRSLCAIYACLNSSSGPIFTSTLLAAISQAVAGNPQPTAVNKNA